MLTRTLFSSKNFRIKSFMTLPEVYLANRVVTISTFPVVFMEYVIPITSENRYAEKPKDTRFKINTRNHYRVTKFFRQILNWFEYDQFRDLFIVDEHDGRLIVNMDFRNLTAKVEGNRLDGQAMLAVPAVITTDSVQSEGCALMINRTNYTITLTDQDIESVYGILKSFSFQQEVSMLLQLTSMKELRTSEPSRYGRNSDTPKTKIQW